MDSMRNKLISKFWPRYGPFTEWGVSGGCTLFHQILIVKTLEARQFRMLIQFS